MKKILTASALLLLGSWAGCQCWETSFQAPGGLSLRKAFFLNDTLGWVVGSGMWLPEQNIFRTVDGGESWQVVNTPYSDLWAVHCLDANTIWVGGSHGHLFCTKNGGLDWEESDVGLPVGTISDIAFAGPDTGWVISELGAILKTTNGGNDWQPQLPPMFNSLRFWEIDIRNESLGWVAGTAFNGGNPFYRTEDGGTAWEAQELLATTITDIDFLNDTLGWVMAQRNQLFKTVNGGDSWEGFLVRTDLACCFEPNNFTCCTFFGYSMDFANETFGMVGQGSPLGLFVSMDGGESWDRQQFEFYGAPQQIWLFDETRGFLITGSTSSTPGNPRNRVYRYRGRPAPCSAAASFPPDGAEGLPLLIELAWQHAEGCVDGYRLLLGTAPGQGDILALDVGYADKYQLTEPLPGGTTVYFSVLPYNYVFGYQEACAHSSFTTAPCPPEPALVLDTAFCQGEKYYGQDTIIWDAGSYTFAYPKPGGCDSVVVLNLAELENSYTHIDTLLLQGVAFQGVPVQADTLFTLVLPAANGCDSIVAIAVDILLRGKEAASPEWRIYPNPTHNLLFIESPAMPFSVELFSLQGQAVAPAALFSGQGPHTMSLEGLPAGVYVARFHTREGSFFRMVARY